MTKILVVGCGDLGGEVAQLLNAAGHEVVGVRRSDKTLSNNLTCIQADVTQPRSLTSLHRVNPTVIIYCVSADAQTDDSYRTHYVDGLENILATQASNTSLQHVFFISSTRVYGQVSEDYLDETVKPLPSDFGGERLLEAESLLSKLPCNTTVIRLTGIYGPERLYLVRMTKDRNRWPKVNKWTNRIHRDDAARFIAFLSERAILGGELEGCYIATDDLPTLQYDVLGWLASKLGTEAPSLKEEGGQVGGKRLSNTRMKKTGFKLKYTNYQLGYSEILKNEMSNND